MSNLKKLNIKAIISGINTNTVKMVMEGENEIKAGSFPLSFQ